MNKADLKSFVQDLPLAAPAHSYATHKPGFAASGDAIDVTKQSFINDKTLVSFAANVTGQNRKDVLNSLLLAQMAANKQFPENADLESWYKVISDTLKRIGWAVEGGEFSDYKTEGNEFEVNTAILEVLGAALGGQLITIAKSLLTALKSLGDKDSKFIAFEKNTHTLSKGCFLVGVADETNGALTFSLAAFILSSSENITQILFFKARKAKSELKYTNMKATLDSDIYADARADIAKRLSDSVRQYVSSIDI